MLFDEFPALFLENFCHLLGHRDGFEDVALFVLLEIEVFAVAAFLVLLAAATRTRSVTGDFLVGHGSALNGGA
jgi:hypothetical protein